MLDDPERLERLAQAPGYFGVIDPARNVWQGYALPVEFERYGREGLAQLRASLPAQEGQLASEQSLLSTLVGDAPQNVAETDYGVFGNLVGTMVTAFHEGNENVACTVGSMIAVMTGERFFIITNKTANTRGQFYRTEFESEEENLIRVEAMMHQTSPADLYSRRLMRHPLVEQITARRRMLGGRPPLTHGPGKRKKKRR